MVIFFAFVQAIDRGITVLNYGLTCSCRLQLTIAADHIDSNQNTLWWFIVTLRDCWFVIELQPGLSGYWHFMHHIRDTLLNIERIGGPKLAQYSKRMWTPTRCFSWGMQMRPQVNMMVLVFNEGASLRPRTPLTFDVYYMIMDFFYLQHLRFIVAPTLHGHIVLVALPTALTMLLYHCLGNHVVPTQK